MSASANKGYDEGQPRNGTIAFYAALTVVTLIGVKFMLDSYFAKTMEGEYHDKVLSRGMEVVKATREAEQAQLDKAGINAAMKAYSQRGRSASPSIAPESGAGKPEIQGWSKLGRVVPAPTTP
ncbi:MAG: hypothetical protein RL385_783 [Pseudomonadota bacterium]|jgi:hypothetical protein